MTRMNCCAIFPQLPAAVVAAISLVLPVTTHSQDRHDYITRLGSNVYFDERSDFNGMVVPMSALFPLSDGTDGLAVTFSLTADLTHTTSPIRLLTFISGNPTGDILQLLYDSGTVTVRKRMRPGSPYYYDYHLYDPLFVLGQSTVTWDIHVFFTGFAFWIETCDTHLTTANRWHAPLFIGIDTPWHAAMDGFISRSAEAKIAFGDPNPPTSIRMPGEIGIYEFNYSSLRTTLNREFSKDVVGNTRNASGDTSDGRSKHQAETDAIPFTAVYERTSQPSVCLCRLRGRAKRLYSGDGLGRYSRVALRLRCYGTSEMSCLRSVRRNVCRQPLHKERRFNKEIVCN